MGATFWTDVSSLVLAFVNGSSDRFTGNNFGVPPLINYSPSTTLTRCRSGTMFKWVLRLPKYSLNTLSTWCQRIGGLLQWTILRYLKINPSFLPYKLLETRIHRNLVASWLSRNSYTQAPWAAHWVLWLTHNLFPHLNCLQSLLEIYQPPLRPVHPH